MTTDDLVFKCEQIVISQINFDNNFTEGISEGKKEVHWIAGKMIKVDKVFENIKFIKGCIPF